MSLPVSCQLKTIENNPDGTTTITYGTTDNLTSGRANMTIPAPIMPAKTTTEYAIGWIAANGVWIMVVALLMILIIILIFKLYTKTA